jgi:lactoylglutathione lyase
MIRHLAHLCFHTDNVAAMVRFYNEGLGLPIKFTMTTDDGEGLGYYFACGDTTFIEIFNQAVAVKKWGGQMVALNQNPSSPYKHFCLEVTGLVELKAKLESRGIEVTPIRTGMDHSSQAWIQDPDGNRIELMEYTAASKQIN